MVEFHVFNLLTYKLKFQQASHFESKVRYKFEKNNRLLRNEINNICKHTLVCL